MADIFKKPGVLVAIAIAIALIIGGVIYMVWRRVSVLEGKQETISSDQTSHKADMVKLQNEVKNRDEKISEMREKISALERQLIEVKLMGRSSKPAKKVKTKCDGDSCTLDVVSDGEE